jgi:hypothetical protein
MKRFLLFILLLISTQSFALDLPAGYVGRVLNNTANTWQHFSFNYTPTVSGSQYVMFAFRQDPAYWYFDNASVKAVGSNTNLITNGNMATGGSLQVQTSNYGTQYINAPTAWGVSYQSGVYPAAAGYWNGSQWVDGAVGSYDGIYQGVTMTAGTTYVIEFDVMGNHTATTTTTGWQLAVYAGACANTSLDPTSCSLTQQSGFQTVASPSQTYTTGCGNNCPPPPAPPAPTYCCGGSDTSFNIPADRATLISNFNNRTTQDSKINIEQIGSYNTTKVTQTGTKNNYVNYYTSGNSNTTEINQSSTASNQTNYIDARVTGSSNQMLLSQQSTGGSKSMFVTVADSNNTVNSTQTGTGSHYLDVNLSGGNKSVTTLQEGSGNHLTSITLTGLPVSINTIQSGNTQQYYSINFNCATSGGCAPITVIQGR